LRAGDAANPRRDVEDGGGRNQQGRAVYPAAFRYFRAQSMEDAIARLAELGEDARPLAGGQSLIPLMKLRFSKPSALVDLNFLPGLSGVRSENGTVRFGALTCHTDIGESAAAEKIPILHDCAAGIADVQVRNRGTIGGSVAEADPTGDWAPVLLALDTEVRCVGPNGERTIPLPEFIRDAYVTALEPAELVREIIVRAPPKGSGGAYMAFKRSAPVYATVSVAAQLKLGGGDICEDCRILLGCVGLLAIRALDAEKELRGQRLTEQVVRRAAEAAMVAAEPQPDIRGTAEYKRVLLGALVRRAIAAAGKRARGEKAEVHHEYTGRN
jgi:aerobic carbon-monoxide dehydrogenase medium subunit